MRLLRRILSLLIVSAYLGATMLAVMPMASAAPAPMSGMTHEQDGSGGKMPCKGMMPGCMTENGCIFMVSLPAPHLTVSTMIGWSLVNYVVADEFLRGRSPPPLLGPPRSRA